MKHHSRRHFLAASAAGLTAFGVTEFGFGDSAVETAADLVTGKDARLLVLKKFPAVLETPLKLLGEQRMTPTTLLFVRNNQQPADAATVSPSTQKEWNVAIEGAVNKAAKISLRQLQDMPQTGYEMVLQCSGNGRSLFSKAAQTSGTQWGPGGMGNVVFRGVRLSDVLAKAGIEVDTTAKFVDANGKDEPLEGKEDFMHSLPVEDVLNRSILALDMNGEALPAIHGGPVRLITPGIYGTMQVKWLDSLSFVTEESTNYNHLPRYRVPLQPIKPGTDYQFTLQNSSYNWNMKVKSAVLTPNEGDSVKSGKNVIKGVAFNDGQAKITSVIVSIDHGQSWRQAVLQRSDSPYGWTQFQLQTNLSPGKQSIWCRAIDELGRSQPIDGSIAWNPRGYEWNGIDKVDVTVT